jgi:hypothetical protein
MSQQAFTITEVDRAILLALSRYHYLTATQAARLLYPNLADENRYMQRRLKKLADAEYILRLRALPTPRYGQAPHVFTLARRGRQYLTALGITVKPYFRPSEEARATENNPFMQHRLAAIDVMIAADCLCRDHAVRCPQMFSERELKQGALRVEVPPGPLSPAGSGPRHIAVIPDAWFQLKIASNPRVSIALELDRGTEDQRVWRHKVAALALWAAGPYRKAFQTDNVTIAVVCPDASRRDTLCSWTKNELEGRGLAELLDIFLLTSASPVASTPAEFFFAPLWLQPHQREPVSLLDPPSTDERKASLRVV